MPKRVVAGLKHGIRCVLFVFVDILDLEKWRGIPALHLSEGRDNPCVRCHCSFSFVLAPGSCGRFLATSGDGGGRVGRRLFLQFFLLIVLRKTKIPVNSV